ncbi:MAG TPA: hypothetical protein VH351_15645 [Bryobacteraceae bacterium]|nr:hypothetical protein [Bryobacteraceae bacterium]
MLKAVFLLGWFTGASVSGFGQAPAADTATAPAAKPTEHVLGTVTNMDSAAQTITVKDDKTANEYVISLAETRTLLKVEPGAKDLHNAVRITAGDLAVADRVDVRGFKSDAPNGINAKSVVLMSARDLAQKHQAELQAWQNSTVGNVTAVDPSTNSVKMSVRAGGVPTPVTIQTSASTEFTRYSADSPKTPAASRLADIQAGDQLHVLGQKGPDGSTISAQKVYSAPVRTIAATVTSVAPDGKQIIVKNLQTKQPDTILLTENSAIRKLPPQMAMFLARRFNPSATPSGAGPNGGGASANASERSPASSSGTQYRPGGAGGPGAGGPGTGGIGPGGGRGTPQRGPADMSRMLERIPAIAASDLKPGDAIVIWGLAGSDPSKVVANTILAGVEPVLQSAPPRQGQSLDGDWGLNVAVPAQ